MGEAADRAAFRVVLRRTHKRWPSRRPQQWWWAVIARNGRTLAHSETYHNRSDALASARLLGVPIEDQTGPDQIR